MPNTHVILTDEDGTDLGECDIMDAHTGEGKLHQAFSIFVFRNGGEELLIQQRSDQKMLFPLFWANSCCSHPQAGETLEESGERRLQEELGFTCPLKPLDSFVYRAECPSGHGVEHEYDTILLGNVDSEVTITPDPAEVADYRWISLEDLQTELDEEPEKFAPWFSIALEHVFS